MVATSPKTGICPGCGRMRCWHSLLTAYIEHTERCIDTGLSCRFTSAQLLSFAELACLLRPSQDPSLRGGHSYSGTSIFAAGSAFEAQSTRPRVVGLQTYLLSLVLYSAAQQSRTNCSSQLQRCLLVTMLMLLVTLPRSLHCSNCLQAVSAVCCCALPFQLMQRKAYVPAKSSAPTVELLAGHCP